MKDTPIQKAIALVNSEILELDAERQPTRLRTLKRQREVLQSLLPYERECIEGAYADGAILSDFTREPTEEAQDYFTNTYNNPQGGGGE